MRILVVGASGLLGSEVCERLVARGQRVRALVRSTSNPDRVSRLRALGVELVIGDLKDPKSLENACQGQDGLVCTASSTFSRQEGDSIETVDRDGLNHLVDAARKSAVQHFVFMSFSGNIDRPSPLRNAKRSVEKHLRDSGLGYTILRPSYFMEVWLSPAIGFDFAKGAATIYGAGTAKISWMSYRDVAEFAVQSLEKPSARNRVLELGGPERLSPLEVVRIFERLTGRKFQVTHVSDETLRQQLATAPDALQKSFAALMLSYAAGDDVPMDAMLREFPLHLSSVEAYARSMTSGPSKG
jgi:uncharacterized protein YbjT (DUF2867 family)